MDGDGNWWDPYCPCRVTRKNIVMTTLAICCLALVTWTVVVTAKDPPPLEGTPSNVTYVFIDDTKEVSNLNLTMSSELHRVKAEETRQEAMAKANKKIGDPLIPMLSLKVLSSQVRGGDFCKCLCDHDVTEEEMADALLIILGNRNKTTSDNKS